MKKILLAFLGMLFFAHLSYATYYKIERGDWAGANLVKNYSNTSYNAYEMIDMYVNTIVKKNCWEGGGDGSKEDRRAIYCPIGDDEIFGDPTNNEPNAHSTRFWKQARCQAYIDDIYYQNTLTGSMKPKCEKIAVGPEYNVYEIPQPYDGWWWSLGNASNGQAKGAWVHHLRVQEAFDGKVEDYYTAEDGLQRTNGKWTNGYEWTGYEVDNDPNSNFSLAATILTSQAAMDALRANPQPCLNYVGYPMYDKTMSYYRLNQNRLIATRENCPTSMDNKAFVTYFTQAACRDAITRNGGAAMAEGSSGSCKKYVHKRYFTVNSRGNFPSKGDNFTERSYATTYYIFRCKNYYNTWSGTRKDGRCQGTYTIYKKNSNGSLEGNESKTTLDVTGIKSQAEEYFKKSNRITCTASNASHDNNPGSASVTCTCGSNKFWSKSLCEAAFTNEPMQYCQENTSAGGVGAGEMKNCADLGADRRQKKK